MSGRAALSGLVAALALVLGLALPDAARAVCATPVDADERVRAADVAFVGRALERREDRTGGEIRARDSNPDSRHQKPLSCH